MDEKVSLIVPIYKVEDDLEDCVNSLISQTYSNLEIILVDDGSPDRCGQIADSIALRDQRVKVIHKPNGGLSDARNAGMKVMTGDYVSFVDSDDMLEPEFIEQMLNLAKKYQAEMVVCRNSVFSKKDGLVQQCDQENIVEKTFSSSEAIKTMLYQKEFDVSSWGKLYRRDILEGVWYPKGLIHEDISTTYKAMVKCQTIAYTSKSLYRYQVRENSIENAKFTLKKMDCITTSQMMLDDISENYPECLAAARSRYFAAYLHILAQIRDDIPEKELIKKNIKSIRGKVITDSNASIRVRGACFLTYISMGLTVKILNLMNKHKYF